MSLIAYGNGEQDTPATAITNNGFWPDIDPVAFRAVERADGSITNARVTHALQVAMADINRQLAQWQSQRQASGAIVLTDVTPPIWALNGHYALLYRRAVYATAMASLFERYRHYSATNDGDERGEAKDEAANDYRRDASWAISEIEGRRHTTVELI